MDTDSNRANQSEMLAELLCRYQGQIRVLENHLSDLVAARAMVESDASAMVKQPIRADRHHLRIGA
jgi:hypothetical protein